MKTLRTPLRLSVVALCCWPSTGPYKLTVMPSGAVIDSQLKQCRLWWPLQSALSRFSNLDFGTARAEGRDTYYFVPSMKAQQVRIRAPFLAIASQYVEIRAATMALLK